MILAIAASLVLLVLAGWMIYGWGFRHGRCFERMMRQSNHHYRPVDHVLRVR